MTGSVLALYRTGAVQWDMKSTAAGSDTPLASGAGYAMAAQNPRRNPHRCVVSPVGRRTRLAMPLVVRRDARLWCDTVDAAPHRHELSLIRGREVRGC